MATLVDLEGATGEFEAVYFSTSSQACSLLKHVRACTAASDTGAINVWIDDEGYYRASFMRNWCERGKIQCKTKKQLKAWLDEWMPHMNAKYPPLPESTDVKPS